MAILSLATDVLPFLKLTADDSFNNVATIHNSTEQLVADYTSRNLESVIYREIQYDYSGGRIQLLNYPVTAIRKLTLSFITLMTIKNTNQYTTAVIDIDNTGLNLTYNGSATTGDYTFATNTTITDLVNAVNTNAAGDGWSASVSGTLGSYKSNELISVFGQETINNTQVSLLAPDIGIPYRLISSDRGTIQPYLYNITHDIDIDGYPYYPGEGDDIFIDYTAGYTSSTMPDDLKTAMLMVIQVLYKKLKEGTFGIDRVSFAGIAIKAESEFIPKEAIEIFNRYRKHII